MGPPQSSHIESHTPLRGQQGVAFNFTEILKKNPAKKVFYVKMHKLCITLWCSKDN